MGRYWNLFGKGKDHRERGGLRKSGLCRLSLSARQLRRLNTVGVCPDRLRRVVLKVPFDLCSGNQAADTSFIEHRGAACGAIARQIVVAGFDDTCVTAIITLRHELLLRLMCRVKN